MKKNIVFIIPSLDAGGAEKSLINLLNVFDFSKYNVDLILFNKSGLFLSMLPKEVVIIEIKGNYPIFVLPLQKSILQFLKQFKFKLAFNRLLFAFKNNFIKNKAVAEQNSWKNIKEAIPPFEKKYDVAIAFLEKSSIYFLVDKIKADNKFGWVHTNYSSSGMNPKFDNNYFKRLNNIITVSKECREDLTKKFPKFITKINVLNNIVSTKMIHDLSKYNIDTFSKERENTVLLSIGRLSLEKGFDLAIDTCMVLLEKGFNVKWYIIGEGNERKNLETRIEKKNLSQNFFLLGLKENPYPFLKQMDIFVQPSRYEGKSIVIDEAKILNKPIVTTNYSTVKDQIQHNVNGLIVEMDANNIADGIIKMIKESGLKEKLVSNLEKEDLGTEKEIYKLYELIER